jgi:hypothetical protein
VILMKEVLLKLLLSYVVNHPDQIEAIAEKGGAVLAHALVEHLATQTPATAPAA